MSLAGSGGEMPNFARLELRYFPPPFPGELFSSLLLRIMWRQEETVTLRAFVNQWEPHPAFHSIWVTDLDRMKDIAPKSWIFDVEERIRDHCILPFFSPFLTKSVRHEQFAWAKRRPHGSFPPSYPWCALVRTPLNFRACPACVRRDLEEHGQPYLHRIHHLPGVNVCLKHQLPLSPVDNFRYPSANRILESLMALAQAPLPTHLDDPGGLMPHLKEAVDHLFARPMRPDEELDSVPLYRLRLDLLGIHQQNWDRDLLGAIRAKYPGKLGESFYVSDWATPLLKRYLNRRRGYHLPPIGHLILHHFLGITLPEALEASDGKLWLCPNPVTSCGRAVAHIPRLVRKNVQVSCEKCGFVAMVDKTSPLGTKPQFYSILQTGDAFDTHLRKLHRQGVPVTEISLRYHAKLLRRGARTVIGRARTRK